ncbi:glycosyltransferase [bacterium AH-315-E10]|nr:glycosyltransferase [bacterium AH-315-E10]
MNKQLTVIIPCYNEAKRMTTLLDFIKNNLSPDILWLFVNDGSTDSSPDELRLFIDLCPDHCQAIHFEKNKGKGAAVKAGLLMAQTPLVSYVDADLAANPMDLLDFTHDESIINGNDILIGIRIKSEQKQVKRFFYRHVIGRCFQTYVRFVTGLQVNDSQCGFKLLATDKAKRIAEQMTCSGFAFDVELLLIAKSMGMNIREEMINWEEKGDSKVRPTHIIKMARDIFKLRNRVYA